MAGIHGRGKARGASTYHVHVDTQRCKPPADKFTYYTAYAINSRRRGGVPGPGLNQTLQIFETDETRPNDHRKANEAAIRRGQLFHVIVT